MSSVLTKIKQAGLMGSCKAGLRLGYRLTGFSRTESGQRFDKFRADFAGFMRWINQSLRELVRFRKDPARRLLTIYDLRSQPFSIGDILEVQQASLVVREQHQLSQIDFAILYDPAQPACPDPGFAAINSENVLFHLASVLPAAQVNPHHGSLFLFNSPVQLNRFIADNADRYHIWPSAWQFSLREYAHRYIFNDLLHNHYQKHGSLPALTCRPFLAQWARSFYDAHVAPDIPVTVQVRQNKTICPERNLRLECWLEFFRHCQSKYPVKFVVICARGEVDERLRDCPNVVIAKDHATTIEQDLALIQTAAMHMGACSGPGMLPIFNTRPYLFVNFDVNRPEGASYADSMTTTDGFWQLSFATPYQRFAAPPETPAMLLAQFERMWAAVNLADWRRTDEVVSGRAFESWMR